MGILAFYCWVLYSWERERDSSLIITYLHHHLLIISSPAIIQGVRDTEGCRNGENNIFSSQYPCLNLLTCSFYCYCQQILNNCKIFVIQNNLLKAKVLGDYLNILVNGFVTTYYNVKKIYVHVLYDNLLSNFSSRRFLK